MRVNSSTPNSPAAAPARADPLTLSRWVNERYPSMNELLSSHDVARLMRRPRWILTGLSLVGRFPRKVRFRGRAIGWSRSEVVAWMSREVALAGDLPFECAAPCMAGRECVSRRPAELCKKRDDARRPKSAHVQRGLIDGSHESRPPIESAE